MLFWVIYLRRVRSLGHRPLIVKRLVIDLPGGWNFNSTQYLCCKVFHDWSIINIRERKLYLIYGNMFATLFKFTGVAYKGPCILIFYFQSNFPPM